MTTADATVGSISRRNELGPSASSVRRNSEPPPNPPRHRCLTLPSTRSKTATGRRVRVDRNRDRPASKDSTTKANRSPMNRSVGTKCTTAAASAVTTPTTTSPPRRHHPMLQQAIDARAAEHALDVPVPQRQWRPLAAARRRHEEGAVVRRATAPDRRARRCDGRDPHSADAQHERGAHAAENARRGRPRRWVLLY